MSTSAERTDPKLWDAVKRRVTDGEKGGEPGQWSARKAQLAVQEYKRSGGGYVGGKRRDNHLTEWTEQDWGTASGKPSRATGERYLPRQARESLTKDEYARTTAKKRADSAKGRQFSAQPKDVAAKTAKARKPAAGASAARKPGPAKARAKQTADRKRTATATSQAAPPKKRTQRGAKR